MKILLGTETTRHQLGAAYILLKMAISDGIGSMLTKHNRQIYEDIQAVILHEMRARLCMKSKKDTSMASIMDDYVDNRNLPCKLIETYTTVMKSNVELKLLLAAFGFQSLPFPGSRDGTGSVVFGFIGRNSRARSVPAGDSTGKAVQADAWHFMTSNFDECGILAWQGSHWSVVKRMHESDGRVDAIFCLDPGSTSAREARLDSRDPSTCLYFFKKNPALLEQMRPLVEALLEIAENEKSEPGSSEV